MEKMARLAAGIIVAVLWIFKLMLVIGLPLLVWRLLLS